MKKAVFLDRDGVINEIVYHSEMGIVDSPFTAQQFQLLPRVAEGIRLLQQSRFKVFVVSNQPGLAKKHFTQETLNQINRKMIRLLKRKEVRLDGIYYCTHHPQAKLKRYRKVCDCRKPEPGLLLGAAREWNIALAESYMIGDGVPDIQAGKAAGCRTVFVGSWKCDICRVMERHEIRPDGVASDLWEAALRILEWEARSPRDGFLSGTLARPSRPEASTACGR
ncbi:MAG: hypothetical protein A3G41_04190 [Elusimicrobia bacterium RIFCSPLOWO2_12_FULL_59_9]|nr:MAG: hypothetical protein A3G41_04190 [Elusimicrobia bacterium RIFCSPLOWO2_12_FULL_59_9]